jgi:hypothetical protein
MAGASSDGVAPRAAQQSGEAPPRPEVSFDTALRPLHKIVCGRRAFSSRGGLAQILDRYNCAQATPCAEQVPRHTDVS